ATAMASAMQSSGSTTPVECFAPNSKAKRGTVNVPMFCTPVLDMPISMAHMKNIAHAEKTGSSCASSSGMIGPDEVVNAVNRHVTVIANIMLAGRKLVFSV